jgi:hypothetical protein
MQIGDAGGIYVFGRRGVRVPSIIRSYFGMVQRGRVGSRLLFSPFKWFCQLSTFPLRNVTKGTITIIKGGIEAETKRSMTGERMGARSFWTRRAHGRTWHAYMRLQSNTKKYNPVMGGDDVFSIFPAPSYYHMIYTSDPREKDLLSIQIPPPLPPSFLFPFLFPAESNGKCCTEYEILLKSFRTAPSSEFILF